MKEAILHLSKDFSIPATEYAIQGNAILGIREAGKTYTAMKAAEELLGNDVPIIVYDPVGIWKNLKVGVGKNKGYQVVVAGGPGSDILLTTKNATDIVRAAMKENVSLVIDLFSPELSNKSTWIKVVQETVDLLFQENINYGLRHIFLEEAAEFIPQRIQPQQARVYASFERLARMGRNSRLGYTIINQRAEEVNKAILEICAFSLLHKQVGKNSLNSIKKWLELRQLNDTEKIIKSLPALEKGECWALGQSEQPQRIKIAERKTYHPDPRKDAGAQVHKVTSDVSGFVEKMNKQLVKEAPTGAAAASPATKGLVRAADPEITKGLRDEIATLKLRIKELEQSNIGMTRQYSQALGILTKIRADAEGFINRPVKDFHHTGSLAPSLASSKINTTVPKINTNVPEIRKRVSISNGTGRQLGKCSREIITFLASFPDRSWSKAQVGVAIGYSSNSGGFNNALSELTTAGFILRDGKLQVNPDAMGDIIAGIGEIVQQDYNIETFKSKLGKCEREIYEVLLEHPDTAYTKDQLAGMTESQYSSNSGGFNNALSRLTTLELIERERGVIKLNPELLELM